MNSLNDCVCNPANLCGGLYAINMAMIQLFVRPDSVKTSIESRKLVQNKSRRSVCNKILKRKIDGSNK